MLGFGELLVFVVRICCRSASCRSRWPSSSASARRAFFARFRNGGAFRLQSGGYLVVDGLAGLGEFVLHQLEPRLPAVEVGFFGRKLLFELPAGIGEERRGAASDSVSLISVRLSGRRSEGRSWHWSCSCCSRWYRDFG